MTSLKEALEAQGFALGGESNDAVLDPAAMAGVDTSNMTPAPVPVDDLEPPAFLKRQKESTPDQPVSSGFGDLGTVPVEPAPAPVVNTPVELPDQVTENVTPMPGNTASNQPNNPAADKRAVLRAIGTLGEQEGFGANARAAFFEKIADAARLGALTENDAEVVQTRYGEGMARAKGIAHVKMPSETQQRSKIKTMIKLGALPGVRADVLIATVKERIKDARDAGNAPKKSPADIYLTVARMQIGQPQFMLTEDQIDQAMASKTPDPKIEADLLYQVASVADKLLSDDAKTPLSDESKKMLEDMIGPLVKRVQELGGTTQMQKEAAKAEEVQRKAAEKAAKIVSSGPKLRNLGYIPGGAARYRSA